eukprot:357762-Chlamydomonas_euryale.AAC.4
MALHGARMDTHDAALVSMMPHSVAWPRIGTYGHWHTLRAACQVSVDRRSSGIDAAVWAMGCVCLNGKLQMCVYVKRRRMGTAFGSGKGLQPVVVACVWNQPCHTSVDGPRFLFDAFAAAVGGEAVPQGHMVWA